MAAPRLVFLDTSFVIALENKDDPHHERAKALDDRLIQENAILMLHWGIFLEIGDGYSRLGRRQKGMFLLEQFKPENCYRIEPLTENLFERAMNLFRSRPDKEWGLTDCISFTLMNLENISEALTADLHFRQAGFRALLLESEFE